MPPGSSGAHSTPVDLSGRGVSVFDGAYTACICVHVGYGAGTRLTEITLCNFQRGVGGGGVVHLKFMTWYRDGGYLFLMGHIQRVYVYM